MAGDDSRHVTIVKDAQWPPRSPHEALLSTPGGRDRLRRLAERVSPSPSPIKRSISTPSIRNKGKERLKVGMDMEELSEDEDEETLQLQLQEIQARLKLKKLQKMTLQNSEMENDIDRASSAPLFHANCVSASRAQSRISELREDGVQRSNSGASVHIPVSPIRRTQRTELPPSPQRILLGIDKGLKGSDVSLKRAPNLRKNQDADIQDRKRTGPFLQRAASQASSRTSYLQGASKSSGEDKQQTFSERMASIRAQETDREERETRIKKNRSMAFDVDHQKMQSFKEAAVELPDIPQPAPEFSRDQVIKSYNKPSGNLARSKTVPDLVSGIRNFTGIITSSNGSEHRGSGDIPANKKGSAKSKSQPGDVTESEASQFEPYSSIHLSKRIVPHKELARILTGKKTFVIPDLLRVVKSPDFLSPDIEQDLVVFAIVARKSEPRSHQSDAKREGRGKYMVMSLTDLKWELDLFLFDSAFEKFWKLTVGTIIAILNPTFLPPPRGKADTGKFSLALNSNADMILEIGTARDLGFCKSVKKDGKTCETWVDKRHTEFCDYHVNETLKKTHAQRMEVNTMNFGLGHKGGRRFNTKDMTRHLDRRREAEERKTTRYDMESHSHIFIGKRSAVNLLDDVDFDPDAFHRGSSKEERMTRRLLAQEKEQELKKKLGQIGGSMGADYMRRMDSSLPESSCSDMVAQPPPDAAALGLLDGKAKDVQLSPVKRKRVNREPNTAALGWGGNLTKELGRMKNGDSLQPLKKKTRFVTEKGIREAGRESFGGEVARATLNDLDDDDDDLDIVKE